MKAHKCIECGKSLSHSWKCTECKVQSRLRRSILGRELPSVTFDVERQRRVEIYAGIVARGGRLFE